MADRSQLLNDAEQAMRLVLDGRQSGIWTAMPGIVKAVDLEAMTVSVQPAIQGTVEDENGATQNVNLPLLVDVPIVFPSAGGFTITFPIAIDDEVLVVFASRCIDSWWQSSGIGRPMEARMHDLSDGFALPGPKSQPKVISGISATAVQIRNDAGTSYVEIGADGNIKLVGSNVSVQGNLRVSGTIIGNGEVVANALTTPIHLSIHTHTSTTPGNPTSGPIG